MRSELEAQAFEIVKRYQSGPLMSVVELLRARFLARDIARWAERHRGLAAAGASNTMVDNERRRWYAAFRWAGTFEGQAPEVVAGIVRAQLDKARAGAAPLEATGQADRVELKRLKTELALTEELLTESDRVVSMFDCPIHGKCVPFAIDEIRRMRYRLECVDAPLARKARQEVEPTEPAPAHAEGPGNAKVAKANLLAVIGLGLARGTSQLTAAIERHLDVYGEAVKVAERDACKRTGDAEVKRLEELSAKQDALANKYRRGLERIVQLTTHIPTMEVALEALGLDQKGREALGVKGDSK